jgi:putative cell wall-binding protein
MRTRLVVMLVAIVAMWIPAAPARSYTAASHAYDASRESCFADPASDFSPADSEGTDPPGDILELCAQLRGEYLVLKAHSAQAFDPMYEANAPGMSVRLGLQSADQVDFVDCVPPGDESAIPRGPDMYFADDIYTGVIYLPDCIGEPTPSELWFGAVIFWGDTSDRVPDGDDLVGPADLRQFDQPPPVFRLAGEERVATAIAVAEDGFTDDEASAVVLASGSTFPDALVSVPLATAADAPVLLTSGDALRPDLAAEIDRLLVPGSPIYIVGGSAAVPDAVEQQLLDTGYDVERLAGEDRFETAVAVAYALGPVNAVFEADGLNFPDALVAGAVAAERGAALVLTAGDEMPWITEDYIADFSNLSRWAIGGWAAEADPDAVALVGANRYETALVVTNALYSHRSGVGIASGAAFPDALAGGAHAVRFGMPLVLADPSMANQKVFQYISEHRYELESAWLYGGDAALPETFVDTLGFFMK